MSEPAITLKVGASWSVLLKGRGTVGYSWSYRVEGDLDSLRITLGPAPNADQFVGPPGESLQEEVKVEALKPGRAVVHLAQSRAWETGRPPLAQKDFEVNVVE